MGIRTSTCTASVLAGAVLFLTACQQRGAVPEVPHLAILEPNAGAVDVPRETTVRVAFDQDLDPASCNPTTFFLEGPTGSVPAIVSYDAPTRSAVLRPTGPLAQTTVYRAFATTGIYAVSGTPVPPQRWEFTTDATPLWFPTQTIDSGRFQALEVDPTGAVWMLWTAADLSTRIARQQDGQWGTPEIVPIPDADFAAFAIDGTGRIVVVGHTVAGQGNVWVTSRTPTSAFPPPTSLAVGGVWRHIDVAANDAGGILVSWVDYATSGSTSGRVRAFTPGLGWGPTQNLGANTPRVWLQAAGDGGHAVYGQHRMDYTWFAQHTVWSERRCVDANGMWAMCDPPLAVPTHAVGSQAAFLADGSTLVNQLTWEWVFEGQPVSRLYEWTPATGWTTLPPTYRSINFAHVACLAYAESGDALLMIAEDLATPIRVHRRVGRGADWTESQLNLPAPGKVGAAITTRGEAILVWLRGDFGAITQPAGGEWTTPIYRHSEPLSNYDELAVVADSTGGAVAAWSANGVVLTTNYR